MSDRNDIESWLPKSDYSFIIIFDARTGWIARYDDYTYVPSAHWQEGMK